MTDDSPLYTIHWTPEDEERAVLLIDAPNFRTDPTEVKLHFKRTLAEVHRRREVIEKLETDLGEERHRHRLLQAKMMDPVAEENAMLRKQVADLTQALQELRDNPPVVLPDLGGLDPKWENEPQAPGLEPYGDKVEAVFGAGPGTVPCCIPFDQFFLLMVKKWLEAQGQEGKKDKENDE